MSDSVRPHRRQPTWLPHPWDSPGKNAGVGCHFLLQCTKVKSESEFAQSCPTLSDPMDCHPAGYSVHGIFQARLLEWGAVAFSEQSSAQSIKIQASSTFPLPMAIIVGDFYLISLISLNNLLITFLVFSFQPYLLTSHY